MSTYAQKAVSAKRQIAKHGAPVTFTRTPRGTGGPSGAVTEDLPLTARSYAIRVPIEKAPSQSLFDVGSESGSLSKREVAYLKVATASLSFRPERGDACTFASGAWEVLGCTAVDPAGTPIVYGVGVVRK